MLQKTLNFSVSFVFPKLFSIFLSWTKLFNCFAYLSHYLSKDIPSVGYQDKKILQFLCFLDPAMQREEGKTISYYECFMSIWY